MKDTADPTATGPELIEAIAAHPTLDVFLDRNPHAQPYSKEEWLETINNQRKERATFVIAQGARRDKRKDKE